jgi:sodium-dependent phosphate cotransporter
MMKELHDRDFSLPTLQGQHPASRLELPLVEQKPARWIIATRLRRRLGKIGLFLISLYLFMLAIVLMKEGARGAAPLVRDGFAVDNVANCLGFGWLFAYLIMSGSPVAAAALTLFDAAVVDKLGAFAMIAGSRLGAGFIVLLIGFLYVLRGRDRATSLSMGLLSLTVTATTYLPGLLPGVLILQTGVLDRVQLRSGALLHSVADVTVEPVVKVVTNLMPDWAIFVAGLGIVLLSFSLFDRCLPQMTLKESQMGWMSRLVYRPWVMFALGALITLVSMSVSLSLSILVPLSTRGFVRRENVIPYIMGANVTTFIDTLLAAVLLNNPVSFTIVLVGMLVTTVMSFIILLTCYRKYQRWVLRFVGRVTANNRNLALGIVVILAVPVVLMMV